MDSTNDNNSINSINDKDKTPTPILIPKTFDLTKPTPIQKKILEPTVSFSGSPTVLNHKKPIPGSFQPKPYSVLPHWYRSIKPTTIVDPVDEFLPPSTYGEWYHNGAALFLTAVLSTLLAKFNMGLGSVLLCCMVIGLYYRASVKKYRRNTRNAIQKEIAKFKKGADEESAEWMNNFMEKFWLIFEPVLSSLVVENLDNMISDYLPSFLDSIRITTFTLGTKPFRIETVKTYSNTDLDTVCMDWKISFIPHDLKDLTETELDDKVNPKIILKVNLNKQAGFPILVKDMTFSGHLRLKIKFVSRYPFAKLVEASFLEKPEFDYVLKPIGPEPWGFDLQYIPGLSNFIREQVHNILGPMMYNPNSFSFDLERFFSGDFDQSIANGVLAVTIYSIDSIKNIKGLVDGPPDTYIRFYIDDHDELDRTSVYEHSFAPSWNETIYLKLNNLNSLLFLELNTSSPNMKDKRLGTASFDLSILEKPFEMDEEGLDVLFLRDGKQVSDLRLDVKYLPISKPTKRNDGTIEPAVESNFGVLRLTIHECQDLISTHEAIHPYVRIIVNGFEKKKTTISNERNPKYEESYEVVVPDRTNFFIRAEVMNGEEVLGAFTSYLTDIGRLQKSNESWWDLSKENEKVGQLRMTAEWKPIAISTVSGYLTGHGFEDPAIGVIRFTFWEAKDLRNVEMVTNGKSDPYVRVLSGHQIRGRTEVKDNNLNPEWGESLYVPVHSLQEDFILEVMDWNAKTRDKSLGFVSFKTTDVVKQTIGDQSVNPDVWYESTGQKFEKWVDLRSMDKRNSKGSLYYSAEFYPALALPRQTNNSTTKSSIASGIDIESITEPLPLYDLHQSIIRYTPDDLVDLSSYNCGILKVKIQEVQFSHPVYAYCQINVDSLLPIYKTARHRGSHLQINESADAFIKETDFSRVAIVVKAANSDEKDNHSLGYLIDNSASIVRRIMRFKRTGGDESYWFNLMGTDGPARVRLSFDYIPMSNYVLSPDESLDNQGILNVDLLSARNLKAADKSGTSDPYVVFTVNGEKRYKSETIHKTLNPKWKGERFTVSIQSRVTASIRIEVFDWNQVQGHQPIGSGGVTLRGDTVESFRATIVDIPLDGVEGVSGSVQVRFKWQPQLLAHRKTHTSVLGNQKTYLHEGTEPSGPIPRRSISTSSSIIRSSIDSPSSERISFDDTSSIGAFSLYQTELSESKGKPGRVKITILEARGLRGVDKSGTSDPFVRVKVLKEQIYKTKVISKTLTPEWNESFIYSLDGEPILFDFKVRDHNKIQSAITLGKVQKNIWDLIQLDITGGDRFKQWLPLSPIGSGELLLDIQFIPL